jgi:hypothetical protein
MHQSVQQLDPAALTLLVRRAHGDDELVLDSWQVAPIGYPNLSPDSRGLFRVTGTARCVDRSLSWSLILKVFVAPADPALDDPGQSFYWRRESLAYRSGILPAEDAGFAAPRCLGWREPDERQIWLWLEDLASRPAEPWSLEQFGLLARQLGGWQGKLLTQQRPLPDLPWLSRGAIRAWTADFAPLIERIARPDLWDLPLLRSFASADIAAVLRLWAEREHWFRMLESLPRTLCHHDLWRNNLFMRRSADGRAQSVAIDWELVGLGAPGEDLGNLFGVSLLNLDVAADSGTHFAELLLESYLDGLRAAGWRGDPGAIRLAFAAAAALRCVFSTTGWPAAIALDPQRYLAETEQRWQRPIAEIVSQWGATTSLLLKQIQR